MENAFTFRKRTFSPADVALVRQMIAKHPEEGRCALSRRLCLTWNWTQPNGQPKDMICRGLLLDLERKGAISLPPMKKVPFKNPFLQRSPPERIEIDRSPIEKPLRELFPISILQVRRSPLEKLFNSLIEEHHYLGYSQPVGEHLKYMAFSGEASGMSCLLLRRMASGAARSLHRVDSSAQGKESPTSGLQHPLFDSAMGPDPPSCLASFGPMQ